MLLHSLGANVRVLVTRVAHLTEAGHKEVIASVVRWRVLLYVGKLHKLWLEEEGNKVHVPTEGFSCIKAGIPVLNTF